MMATVLRKVKLGNKNKSDLGSHECQNDSGECGPGGGNHFERESVVPCSRVCGLVNVCARPADSMGNCRRRNRPQRRRNANNHLTLFRSLQLRIDLWTSTTGSLLDRSFARRFCGRKCDNELYRSNSFRFEKFERQEEDPQQQVGTDHCRRRSSAGLPRE
ncbi:UNVERIFIED_CONTAM: hypothetical protein PYX00_008061 [Menopon gallinae]|uniref:Uncharacterized protein n=1 Tax=Menopon gallinae TaxID=328185 RepID=A0AAW2HLS0_9NEOP